MSRHWGNCQICSGTRFIDLNRPCGNCDKDGNAPRVVVADIEVEQENTIPVQVEKPVGRRARLRKRALEIEFEKANRPL